MSLELLPPFNLFNQARRQHAHSRLQNVIPFQMQDSWNSGNLCYSNAIFQAFASCQLITTFGNQSPQNHDNIRLCYEFTTLLNSMMTEETVNPKAYTDLIQERYTRFVDVESEYYICNPISIDKHIK